MEAIRFVVFMGLFSSLCYVVCELNLPEGSPCTTKGLNGTCINIFKCDTAAYTNLYTNSGFLPENFPEIPEICSYKDNEPVVCCTDCKMRLTSLKDMAVGPLGVLVEKEDSIAVTKCYEYFEKLPYSCRGRGNIKFEKKRNEEKQCYDVYSIAETLPSGGRDAERWEFPHMALIGYGKDVDLAEWKCGGSVISERFILTAAHCCCSTVQLGYISFAALGLLKRTDPKKYWKIYKIKRIIMHPEYKSPSKYDDIALLETKTKITFGKDLLPACLNIDQGFNHSCEVAGWGRLGHRKALADTLQVVHLEAVEESECDSKYPPHRHTKHGNDHKKQICYGSHTKSIDTCEGDSGGPLQHNKDTIRCLFHIVGVTSHSKDCGFVGAAVYTRVSYYVPWIESVVWPEETEAKRKKNQLLLDVRHNVL